MTYLKNLLSRKATPQSLPIPGSAQVANSAGGYAFAVDDWVMLERFLILGTEGGSYYAAETRLTRENAHAVLRCIEADGARAVARIVAVSVEGRAPRTDPAIFALALAASFGSDSTRRLALSALPRVCRTGTHLFHFAAFADGMRGWGRGLRGAIAHWYEAMDTSKLAYQAVKYQQRDGWGHRDLLRLSHPRPSDSSKQTLYHWMTQGWPRVGDAPHPDEALRLVWAWERAKRAETAREIVGLIGTYGLPREAVPSQWLTHAAVWEALLPQMPLGALVRNLATLTRVGLLADADRVAQVAGAITDPERLRAARVHPVALLSALRTYAQGHGERGGNTWTPVRAITDALDRAFYAAFANIEPTGRRWLLALDVSGSMGGSVVAGIPGLTARDGSAAMALVTSATESACEIVGFCDTLRPLDLRRKRLDSVIKAVSGLPFGATDCALPMEYARKKRLAVDAFVVYTDSETWHGTIHPVQALRAYREAMGIAAKLIVVGMVANKFTIADPTDAGMLDVVGFDTAAPGLIADFVR